MFRIGTYLPIINFNWNGYRYDIIFFIYSKLLETRFRFFYLYIIQFFQIVRVEGFYSGPRRPRSPVGLLGSRGPRVLGVYRIVRQKHQNVNKVHVIHEFMSQTLLEFRGPISVPIVFLAPQGVIGLKMTASRGKIISKENCYLVLKYSKKPTKFCTHFCPSL